MGLIKFSFLAVLSLVLATSLLVILVGINLNKTLYPDFYNEILNESNIYEFVNANINATGPGVLVFGGNIEKIILELLNKILGYVRGESREIDLRLNIDQERLNSFFLEKASELPNCKVGANPFSDNIPPCIPAGINYSQFAETYLEVKDFNMSGEIDLDKEFGLKENIDRAREYAAFFRKVFFWSVLILIVSILMIIALKINQPPFGAGLIGIDVLIAGFILLGLAEIANNFVTNSFVLEIEIFNDFINNLVNTLLNGFQKSAVKTIAVGFIIFVIGLAISLIIKVEKIKEWLESFTKKKKTD